MNEESKISETAANTAALNANTDWIIISIVVAIVLFIAGFAINKYRTRNIIKSTKNKNGKISQSGKDNFVDNVDNEHGTIEQN